MSVSNRHVVWPLVLMVVQPVAILTWLAISTLRDDRDEAQRYAERLCEQQAELLTDRTAGWVAPWESDDALIDQAEIIPCDLEALPWNTEE